MRFSMHFFRVKYYRSGAIFKDIFYISSYTDRELGGTHPLRNLCIGLRIRIRLAKDPVTVFKIRADPVLQAFSDLDPI